MSSFVLARLLLTSMSCCGLRAAVGVAAVQPVMASLKLQIHGRVRNVLSESRTLPGGSGRFCVSAKSSGAAETLSVSHL